MPQPPKDWTRSHGSVAEHQNLVGVSLFDSVATLTVTVQHEASPPVSGISTPGATATDEAYPDPPESLPSLPQPANPEQARMQEEYLKALLGRSSPDGAPGRPQNQPGSSEEEDPMMKMLSSMMSGLNGNADPNNPGGLPFNPEELSKATGMPSYLTNMLMGNQKAPPTPAEIQSTRFWRVLHVIFALVSGLYHVMMFSWAEDSFGGGPPAPATFQNPFVVFALGEILLQSARVLLSGPSGKRGPGLYLQMAKEFAGDGAVIVFILGLVTWLKGG